jgi:hypothetical protein
MNLWRYLSYQYQRKTPALRPALQVWIARILAALPRAGNVFSLIEWWFALRFTTQGET